jgi:hypothetical protein
MSLMGATEVICYPTDTRNDVRKDISMKRAFRIFALLTIALCASSVVADTFEVNIFYYTDRALTNEVGQFWNYCDGSTYYTGSIDNYRVRQRHNCMTGGDQNVCEEFINGAWEHYTCPAGW